MTRTAFSASLCLALMSTTALQAQSFGQGYIGASGGFSTMGTLDNDTNAFRIETEIDDSYMLSAVAGLHLGYGFRGELEFAFATYDATQVEEFGAAASRVFTAAGEVTTKYALANIWYDFEPLAIGVPFVPYVGGGVGVVNVQTDVRTTNTPGGYRGEDTGLAYQAGLGVRIPIDTISLDLGYRLKGASGFDIDNFLEGGQSFTDGSFTTSNLTVGMAFSF